MKRRKRNIGNDTTKTHVNKRRRQDTNEMYDLYNYDGEKDSAITLDSFRRSKRYIALSIIFVLASLMLIVGFMFIKSNSETQKQHACWKHQQQVEQLATKYATNAGLASLPAYIEDVPGYSGIQSDCPTGGSYTWNPVSNEYYCSEHSHWPPGFNQAQSINQGTQTTMVDGNS